MRFSPLLKEQKERFASSLFAKRAIEQFDLLF